MRKMIVAAVTAALTLALAVPALGGTPSWAQAAKPSDESIVDIATGDAYGDSFNVLVAAVSRAGLVPLLDGNRQLTVFAPTDAAFEAAFNASEGVIIGLINDGALDGQLGNILGYHVTDGRRISKSVLGAPTYRMLNGDLLTQGELVAAGLLSAPVLVDIPASNGVIHVLTENVLMPTG